MKVISFLVMPVVNTHAVCACVIVFSGGDGQSAAAAALLRGTCRVQVPAANPAGG